MPLSLAQQGARLLLACRFESYENDRSLSLHRMTRARDTGVRFERPQDLDLQRYDDDGRFGFGQGETIQLVFRLPRDAALHLRESPLSIDQKRVEVDGQREFTASVVESLQLRWWPCGFGKRLTLISPKSLLEK